MMTVHEVSRLTGVSIRTLQYYDQIGLLKATAHTAAGYRQYDESALEVLQQILLFRELEFSLKDIKRILCSPDYDKGKALEQQIRLLELKKERISTLIDFARGLKLIGGKYMSFTAFDRQKLDEYTRQAKASWGDTDAYREFAAKSRGRSESDDMDLGRQLMDILAVFGALQDRNVGEGEVVAQVEKLQAFITAHYYTCTDPILASLGQMYGAGGAFSENIDAVGGPGTALYAAKAIAAYCNGKG